MGCIFHMNVRTFIFPYHRKILMVNDLSIPNESRRDEILHAAYKLFVEHGYHGASMRQIAHDSGIVVGGLYNHFANKEDIFVAVLEAYHPYRLILPALRDAQGKDLEAFVRDAAETMIEALVERPDFLNLMFIEIVEFKSKHIPLLFKTLYPQFLNIVNMIGDKKENMRPIPVPMVIRAFIGLFFSYYVTEVLLEEGVPSELRENALYHFVDIFLYGIVQNPKSRER